MKIKIKKQIKTNKQTNKNKKKQTNLLEIVDDHREQKEKKVGALFCLRHSQELGLLEGLMCYL